MIRCYEWDRMFEFWQQALHYKPKYPPDDGWVILADPSKKGPNVSLDRSPKKREWKRSWVHLDLYVDDQEAEVERLVMLGAKR